MGRNTQGVKLANITDDGILVAVQKVECEEQSENGLEEPIANLINGSPQEIIEGESVDLEEIEEEAPLEEEPEDDEPEDDES